MRDGELYQSNEKGSGAPSPSDKALVTVTPLDREEHSTAANVTA